ncbi:glycoside hydrolase family 18 protein [Stenotrophomonas sp. 24(2023)]|uniref:glycoside hydrolase family 18 protein n=1 Tax=Stenotrophomonas sp. 24(2023) TaxID=3068324 RepID=UPI0027E0BB22|nr:glycoside hydrolase family 18 protein [Stenotrophomonas sp. 24(2023)]WMJ69919.1 glycoside hydrolase family 18 protein [Stenotrophomonas sp. 24(2023)]
MFRQTAAVLAVLLASTLPTVASAAGHEPDAVAAPATPVVFGAYYPGGSASRYPVSAIPADRLTHLFYAFSTIKEGRCVVGDEAPANFAALADLKRAHPHLQTLISIGGWNAGGFSDAALTPASRKRFIDSCMALFFDRHAGSFDGVDIDWEFPVSGGPTEIAHRPQDRANFTRLAVEFRAALDARGRKQGRPLLLTAALAAGRLQTDGPYDPAASYDLPALAKVLDFINLMSYDMGTGFSSVSTFNAPLHAVDGDPLQPALKRWNNVAGAVQFYREHGVPADKLVLGVPFYGRGFKVTGDAPDGLYQPYSAPADAGDWRVIRTRYLGQPGWTQHWQAQAQSPWLYNASEKVFISYEDPRSIAIRSHYARSEGLRGVFMWELTGDDEQASLLRAMLSPYEDKLPGD